MKTSIKNLAAVIVTLSSLAISSAAIAQNTAPVDSAAIKAAAEQRRVQEDFRLRNDWADLKRFEADNAKVGLPKPGENRVVFMGNSITIGWSRLQPDFFKDKPYINRGISGQTTPQMLIRFRPDVIDLKPKVVVILAGTNDIAGNTGVTSDETIINNIMSMAQLAQVNGIKVVLSSILPVYDYPWKRGLNPVPRIANINKHIKEFAEKNKMIYLDYFPVLADERQGMKSNLANDGVHPTKEGYEAMAPLAEAAIQAALKLK